MELRLTVLRPGQSLSSREHRLVFETNTPSNNPPQGGLNNFDRLHQGSDLNANQRPEGQDRRDNVYDRMTKRQAAYRDEVNKLEQYIAKTTAATESQGTIKRVNVLIEDLRNVYQQEYTDRNGTRRTYENGRYATVDAVESAYNNIETIITSLEGDLARANGGALPNGLQSYQDRVRDARRADALAGRGTGSVDVRTYSVPFRPESASETSTYSLLRIPANFQFRWGANPRVAEIISGKYDIQGGMSNGIKYLRLQPAAATALARENLSVPVAIESAPGRVQEMTTARFVADGPIVENPNAGNTLIHIEYSTPTAPGPNQGPDMPNGDGPGGNGNGNNENVQTPEQINAKNEGDRKAFHETWEKNNKVSEDARIVFTDIDGTNDTSGALAAGRAEAAALVTERSHLELRGSLPPVAEGGDNSRQEAYEKRIPEIAAREAVLAERMPQLQAYAEFATTQEGLQKATEDATNAIPTATPDTNDVEGWEALRTAIADAQTAANSENNHLISFEEGNPAPHSGANDAQRTAVAERTAAVAKLIGELQPREEAAQEGIDEAKREVFHTRWEELNKETMGASMAFGNADREDVSATISALQPYIDAIIAEKSHLELRGGIPNTKPDDTRPAQWEARAGETITLQSEMQTMMEQLRDLQAFQAIAEDYQTSTESMKTAANQPEPAADDVAGWQTRIENAQQWRTALTLEQGHLNGFTGSEGENVATDAHKEAVVTRLGDVNFDLPEAEDLINVAQEGKNEAERQVFDTEFNRLNGESRSAASWEDGDPEDTASKIDLLKAYVAALTAENEHLAGASVLPDTKENDERFTTWSERSAELGGDGGLIDQMQQQLEKFEAFQEFDNNAIAYKNETEGADAAIPATDPVANDLEGWESMKTLSEAYVTTLEVEEAHLETFAGSIAEDGATETQAEAVRTRLQEVKDLLKDMRDTELPRVEEARNEAECLVFEEKWKDLKDTTDSAKTGYEEAVNNGADATTRLSELVDYVKAMEAEDEHLGTLNREVHKPGDPRLDDYTSRIGELATALPEMTTMQENLADLVEFQEDAAVLAEATDTLQNAIPDAPEGRGKVQEWQDRKEAIDAYIVALNEESEHTIGLVSRPGVAAATDSEIGEAFDTWLYVQGELQTSDEQLTQATNGLNEAKREKFEDDWEVKKSETNDARFRFADELNSDNFGEHVTSGQDLLTKIDAEVTHLDTVDTAYPTEGATNPARVGEITAARDALVAERATVTDQLEAARTMQTFEKTRTARNERSEKTKAPAENALAALPPEVGNTNAWTARANAIRPHVAALTEERTHLQTLPATGRQESYADGVTARIEEITKTLETMEKALQEADKNVKEGVEATVMPDNLRMATNARNTTDVKINRFDLMSIRPYRNNTSAVAAGGADLTAPGMPKILRTPGNNDVTVDTNGVPSGMYILRVGAKVCVIQVGRLLAGDTAEAARKEEDERQASEEKETKEKGEKETKAKEDSETARATVEGLLPGPLGTDSVYSFDITPPNRSFDIVFTKADGTVIRETLPGGLNNIPLHMQDGIGGNEIAVITRSPDGSVILEPKMAGNISIEPENGDAVSRRVLLPTPEPTEEPRVLVDLPEETTDALNLTSTYVKSIEAGYRNEQLTFSFTPDGGTATEYTLSVPPDGEIYTSIDNDDVRITRTDSSIAISAKTAGSLTYQMREEKTYRFEA